MGVWTQLALGSFGAVGGWGDLRGGGVGRSPAWVEADELLSSRGVVERGRAVLIEVERMSSYRTVLASLRCALGVGRDDDVVDWSNYRGREFSEVDVALANADVDYLTVIVLHEHELIVALEVRYLSQSTLLLGVGNVRTHGTVVLFPKHGDARLERSFVVSWVYFRVSVWPKRSLLAFGSERSDEVDLRATIFLIWLRTCILWYVLDEFLKIRNLVLRVVGWHSLRSGRLTLVRLGYEMFAGRFGGGEVDDSRAVVLTNCRVFLLLSLGGLQHHSRSCWFLWCHEVVCHHLFTSFSRFLNPVFCHDSCWFDSFKR